MTAKQGQEAETECPHRWQLDSHRGLLNTNHMSRPTIDVRPNRRPPSSIPQISLPAPAQQWVSTPSSHLHEGTRAHLLHTLSELGIAGATILLSDMHGCNLIQCSRELCTFHRLGYDASLMTW